MGPIGIDAVGCWGDASPGGARPGKKAQNNNRKWRFWNGDGGLKTWPLLRRQQPINRKLL